MTDSLIRDLVTASIQQAKDFQSLYAYFKEFMGSCPRYENLPPQLCAFCHNLLVNATTLTCGHTHCPNCISSRIKCWCGQPTEPLKQRRNIVIGNTVQQIFPHDTKLSMKLCELEGQEFSDTAIMEVLVRNDMFTQNNIICNLIQGRYHLSRNDYSLAASYINLVTKKDPLLAAAWCYLAEIHAKEKKYIEALSRLLLSQWLDPFIPHSEKLCRDVFHLAKEKCTQYRRVLNSFSPTSSNEFIEHRDLITDSNYNEEISKKRSRIDCLDTKIALTASCNRVTYNAVTCATEVPNTEISNVISSCDNDKRNKLYDTCMFDNISFSFDTKKDAKSFATQESQDIVDTLSIGELGDLLRSTEMLEKAGEGFSINLDHLRSGDLECPLCLRIYWEPDVTPCGHTFCGNCLERTLDHDPKCPLCKQSLIEFLETRQHQARNEYSDKQLINIISRWLPDEYQERLQSAREEEREMLEKLPIFVCTLAFPGVPCPLHVFEPRHRLLLRRCIRNRNGIFGMNLPRTQPGDIPFERIGTKLKVRSANYFRDGRVVVESNGVGRFRVLEVSQVDGYDSSTYVPIIDKPPKPTELMKLTELSNQVHNKANEWFSSLPEEMSAALVRHFGPMPSRVNDDAEFVNEDGPSWPWWVLAVIPAEDKIKMHVLAQTSLLKRLTLMSRVIACIINNSATTHS